MDNNLIGTGLSFAVGFCVSLLNFLLSREILKKHPDKYAFSSVLRQIIQIAYLVAVYLVSGHTPWDTWYMLIGGVLGVTVPMFYFTHKLLQINKTIITEKHKKEGEDNG